MGNKKKRSQNLRWSGMPLASLTCEISKMQVWMNIMFYYSILLEGVRSSKCSISLPGPSCAHESSGAVTSSRTLQTAGGSGGSEKTNEAEPLGAASFVESQIRQKSLAMLMESVSGLHLQLQASSWSDTSLVSYCKALGRYW